MTRIASRRGFAVWSAAVLAVLTHLALGALAVVELARLDWLASMPWELTAVCAVAGSGVLAVAGAARVGWPAIRGGRALRRLLRMAGGPPAAALRTAAEPLCIAAKIQVVAATDAFAVTHGLIRPRILVSTGLVEALDPAELTAVLVHERHHLRRRDPLRLLASRLLAGYGWFLRLLRWWAQRLAIRRELAADGAATSSAGVAAVAGALRNWPTTACRPRWGRSTRPVTCPSASSTWKVPLRPAGPGPRGGWPVRALRICSDCRRRRCVAPGWVWRWREG